MAGWLLAPVSKGTCKKWAFLNCHFLEFSENGWLAYKLADFHETRTTTVHGLLYYSLHLKPV